ncbi:MAG: DUF4147 domain-containing protein, partial [Alphaproteobacteria bacterium]|nr:DUF4147 domain-containing protein [Alphaproteobacteria bacterium]
EITSHLLNAGAPISQINLVRRHLSAIKGGRLAAVAAPAKVITLAISDVPGDDPLAIASGPTVADETTGADALAVLERYVIEVPASVRIHLEQETPVSPPAGSEYFIVASAADAIKAAARKAEQEGWSPVLLGEALEGEAQQVGRSHGELARRYLEEGRPALLLSGGELTVTHNGSGEGGPNHEYALSVVMASGCSPAITVLAGDTDGLDGTSGAAGVCLNRGLSDDQQQKAAEALSAHNTAPFLKALGAQIETGPTDTSVNDFRAILIEP